MPVDRAKLIAGRARALQLLAHPYGVFSVARMPLKIAMDQATTARLFEPFFTIKPVGEGTGLGRSMAHGIIHQHGGRIAVVSRVGAGTRFDVYLPGLTATASADKQISTQAR